MPLTVSHRPYHKGLSLVSPDETIYQQADKYNPDGVISIGAHGDENGMQYANGDKIDLDSLGEAIRNLQKFKDNPDYPIQIDSCDVGNNSPSCLLEVGLIAANPPRTATRKCASATRRVAPLTLMVAQITRHVASKTRTCASTMRPGRAASRRQPIAAVV